MAYAHKGGISRSPGQRFAAPKQRYAPLEWWFVLGRTKAITPNRPRRTAIPRQKMPLGGLAAAFSSLAGRKSDRKAPNGAPNAMLDPCSEAPYRRFLPSCEQNRATAASRKEKPVKRYEHLAGIRPDALSPLSTRCFCPKRIASAISHRLQIHPRTPPLNHRFDMALRLFH